MDGSDTRERCCALEVLADGQACTTVSLPADPEQRQVMASQTPWMSFIQGHRGGEGDDLIPSGRRR